MWHGGNFISDNAEHVSLSPDAVASFGDEGWSFISHVFIGESSGISMGCIGSWFLIDVIVLHIKKKIIKKCFLKNYYYYFYGPLRV